MAGYKQTVIDDGAIALWSFDGDLYDPVNRNLLANPLLFIDDAGDNLNPAILHSNTYIAPFGYRMGLPGLVEIESSTQKSISFGYYGKQPVPEIWPKAFIEVPHSDTFAFDKDPNFPAFTIEFMLKKTFETAYMQEYNLVSLTRPIIRKNQVFNMWWSTNYNEYNVLKCQFPTGNTGVVSAASCTGNNPAHIVITWKVSPGESSQFVATECVYVNGRLEYTASKTYDDTFPSCNVNSPFEIGGLINTASLHADRNTSSMQLDQIAVYETCLDKFAVARHYKKVFSYDKMVLVDGASNYWIMDDPDALSSWTAVNSTGGALGKYAGDIFTVKRGLPGPTNIPGSKSAMFVGGSEFLVDPVNHLNAPTQLINTNGSYSVEFWFNATTTQRGILFLSQSDNPPYHGPCVAINWKDNVEIGGYVQFSENNTTRISSLVPGYSDGKWHHCCIQRNGTTLELWLDSELQGQLLNVPANSTGHTGWIHMMNSKPGHLRVDGHVCRLALYGHALQPAQIASRFQYSNIYRVRGIVTLQGIPTRATIRIFHHNTGNLIAELESNINTGAYEYILPNNSWIDLLVFNKNDKSVRYRAYGPIEPAYCEDLPINL